MAQIDRPDWSGNGDLVPSQGNALDVYGGSDDQYLPQADAFAAPKASGNLPSLGEVSGHLPPSLLAAWQNDPAGPTFRLRQAQAMLTGILSGLGPDERFEILGSFEDLPVTAQTAIIAEMSLGSSARNAVADAEAIEAFKSDPAGRICAQQWRGAAPRNIATIAMRAARLVRSMSASDAQAFFNWLDDLSPYAAAALLKAIAK